MKIVACNIVNDSAELHAGAKAYLMPSPVSPDYEGKVHVLARSRDGRWVSRWLELSNVSSYRIRRLPPVGPVYSRADGGTVRVLVANGQEELEVYLASIGLLQ